MRGSAALRTGITPGGALAGPWVRNPLWTAARAVPSLDLRFADNKSLTDATTGQNLVTFTRASSGTYVDSQGVIRTATTNLLLRSEEFDNASWTRERLLSVTANAEIAPNGYLVAERIVEDSTASNTHTIYQAVAGLPDSTTFTFSVYLKAAGRTKAVVAFMDKSATTRGMLFDLSQGTVSSFNLNGIVDTTASNIAAIGNGWYRCSVQQSSGTGAFGPRCWVQLVSGSTNSYTGDGTSGLYLWGAQLEASSAVGEYVPTTSTINSAPRFDHNPTTGESLGLLVEEQRTNSIRNNTMVGAVAGTPGTLPTNWSINSPTGLTRTISLNTVGGISCIDFNFSGTTTSTAAIQILPESLIAASNGQSWTSSAWVQLLVDDAAVTSLSYETWLFDSASAFLSTGASNNIYTARFVFDRRIIAQTLSNASVAFVRSVFRTNAIASGTAINLTLRIGLPQLEQGAFATSVIPTTTATVTRSADVASITGSNFGVSRTNLLLRSEEFDNGAAWGNQGSTDAANSTTAPNGTLTADEIIEDSGTANHYISQGLALTSGITYTYSCYIKASQRSFCFLVVNGTGTIHAVSVNLSTGAATSATGSPSNIISTAVGNDWYRVSFTYTSGTTGFVGHEVRLSTDGVWANRSYTGNGTGSVYAWGAQLETGSAATAYIPTTSAAVTVVDSSWYRQDEGTVFAENQLFAGNPPANSFPGVLSANNGTTTNQMMMYWSSSTVGRWFVRESGTVTADVSASAVTAGMSTRMAVRYASNDAAISANGGAVATDTSVVLPIPDRLTIGAQAVAAPLNGTIRRLTYWPQRLSNSTLQALTQ